MFSIGNGLGVYGAPAAYAKSKGIKNAALIAIDVPGASGPARQLGPACFGNAGIPGGYAGIKTVTTQAADTSDPDYQLFLAVQKKYDGATDAMAVFGYVPLLALIRALNAAKITDTSAAGVSAGLKAAPAAMLPLGKGATFKCDGTALPAVSKNICSLAAIVADTDTDGKLSNSSCWTTRASTSWAEPRSPREVDSHSWVRPERRL